jgi:hypothetical protein
MTLLSALDSAGRRRSPATLPGYHAGRPPRNKGVRYPVDPPTVEEIVAVMRQAADDRHGWRLRAMIVVLWRAGLRIQEALALAEHDVDPRRGSLRVRDGKGGKRREVGMDEWGWEQLRPWLRRTRRAARRAALLVIDRPTAGDPGRAPRSAPSPPARSASRRPASLRAAPAAPRARARARPRRRPAQHHPAPTRARQPRHDLDLSARNRPRGDHRSGARTTRPDDVGQRRAAALSDRITSGSAPALRSVQAEQASAPGTRDARASSIAQVVGTSAQRLASCSERRARGNGRIAEPTFEFGSRKPSPRISSALGPVRGTSAT